jgi:hypothetical protein
MKELKVSSPLIEDYCNAIIDHNAKARESITEKLDQFSTDIRYIQEHLSKGDVESFTYSWESGPEVIDNGATVMFGHSLIWDKNEGKVLYMFSEDEEPSVLLGTPKLTRLAAMYELEAFLERGVKESLAHADLVVNGRPEIARA